MGRSQETYNKKEVRNKKEKKRKEKEQKRIYRKTSEKSGGLDDMIAYVDEFGVIHDQPPMRQKQEVGLDDIQISVPKQTDTRRDDPVKIGVITFFNTSKGFGFIAEEGSKREIFLHVSNLKERVEEGDKVNYEIEMGMKGPTAVNVKLYREVKVEAKPVVAPEVENDADADTNVDADLPEME
jgi:cold shock CspA family protein